MNDKKKLVHFIDLIYYLRVLHGSSVLFFWKIVYSILSVRRKRDKVIFTSFSGSNYSDNPSLILETLHTLSPNTELVWLRKTNSNYSVPLYVRTVLFGYTFKMMNELASAKICIDNDNLFYWLSKNKRTIWIQTWHGGLGFKKMGFDADPQYPWYTRKKKNSYDFYISNSSFLTGVYRSAFCYKGLVWKCGFPVEDAMLFDNGEREMIHSRYGISSDINIVLYAPTFRDNNGWVCDLDVPNVIRAFESRFGGKWCLAIRWHHAELENMERVVDAIDMTDFPNMQTLTKGVDAFISDYSSGIFHAKLRNIPCFVYAPDYEYYRNMRGMHYSLDELPFPYAITMNGIVDSILTYDERIYDSKWKEFRKRTGHVVTGHSAEDIAKICVQFLNGKSKKEIMDLIPFEKN